MEGHLVLVTGGSSGIGRAVLAAAPEGAFRVDISRRGAAGVADRHVAADLADPAGWAAAGSAIEQLVAQTPWRRITFVHSAGVLTPIGFAGEVDTDAYTRNVLLNSAATQVLGQVFLAATEGHPARRDVLFVSSGAAKGAPPGWSSYGAAKAAGEAWVRTVAAEQQVRGGARVIAVAPGVVATAMQEEIRGTGQEAFPAVERFQRMHAAGELREPADVAAGLWQVLDDPSVGSGDVIDLRDRLDG